MGLIARIQRLAYVWGWRIRYWWLDTPAGEAAHWWLFAGAGLVFIVQLVHLFTAAAPPQSDAPLLSVVWWVWQLVILVVAAAISYAMRPKTEQPQAQDDHAPTVQDGRAVKDYFGDNWIDDPFELAWKIVGRDKIKTKGGKK